MNEKERNPFDPPGRARGIGRIVFYAISVLLIVLLVAVLLSITILRKEGEPPSVFGFSVYIVATDSMEPAISPGSALLVQKTKPANLQVDDVITFQEGYDQDGQMLINTHRIVEIVESGGERTFRTKGDKNDIPDDKLRHSDDILGRAVSYIPGIGRFFAFVKTPLGLICCIAVPLFILLVFEIINLIRLSRRSKEEELLEEEEEASQGPLALAVNRRRELFSAEASGPELIGEPPPPAVSAEPADVLPDLPLRTGLELPPEVTLQAGPIPQMEPTSQIESTGRENSVLRTGLEEDGASQTGAPAADLSGIPLQAAPMWQTAFAQQAASVQQTASVQQEEGTDYGFSVPAEREDVPLEMPSKCLPDAVDVRFRRTAAEPLPAAHITREFAAAPQPAAVSPSVPVESAPSVPAREVPVDTDPAFLANMASQGKDRFQIDGIDVHVKPDSINLALDGDRETRDISITVTEECTNVTVGTKGREVNFSLFRDEKGQKVIIQKKAR